MILFDSKAKFWGDPALNPGLSLPQNLSAIDATTDQPNVSISNFLSGCTATSCGELVPGSSTSIGGGLVLAEKAFPNDGNNHAILLMTDGLQNTDPKVIPSVAGASIFCDDTASPLCTTSLSPHSCPNTSPCPLSDFATATVSTKIYAVTVGVGTGVSDDSVIGQVAVNTQGFLMNTETNAALLSPMFLQLLQNFLRFFSYETVRMIADTAPYSATIPISGTSHNVAFSLMWPSQAAMRLTITPPGGVPPIVQESASGFISVVRSLPLASPFNAKGNWTVLIESLGDSRRVNPAGPSAVTTADGGNVPFDLHVMTDDAGIKSDLSIVPADYKPGDKIRLRAKFAQFGDPIIGLGSNTGDRIEAELVRPGKSIGDLLSGSDADSTPQPCPVTGPCDKQSRAEAKLANMLKNPKALDQQVIPHIQLFDDGKPEHGDDVAGDGIYSALYLADLPGHYNFLIGAERVDASGPRFSRQQLRTAYVRPFPDGGNTDFQTSIISKGTLQIIMTPRGKFNDRLGPGWANYFWFTAPGVTPFKPADNLTGTYTATLNFTGSKPPQVSVHFEDVIAIIGDSVTPDQLPQPLNSNNVLAPVPPPAGKLALFVDLGATPTNNLPSGFNNGINLNGAIEYLWTPHVSLEGILGYHHFGSNSITDLKVFQFGTGGRAYSSTFWGSNRLFGRVGIGGYHFSDTSSTNFGGYAGLGVLHEFKRHHWGIEGADTFHAVNTSGGATHFSALQGGLRWVF